MKHTKKAVVAAFLLAAAVAGAQAPGIKRTVLQKADVTPEREVVMAQAEISAGGETGRHTHPGVEVGYVLEGSTTVTIDGEEPKVYKAGDSYTIPYGKVHNARNASDKSAKVLANYIVEKGKPLASPAP